MHNIQYILHIIEIVWVLLVYYSRYNGSVFCCILQILVNVVGYFGISCIQIHSLWNIHTAYCGYSMSSLLVCNPNHIYIVLCCILHQYLVKVAYFGIPCIVQTPFMQNIHTAEIIRSALVCYSKQQQCVLLYATHFGKCRLFWYFLHIDPLHAQYSYCIQQK